MTLRDWLPIVGALLIPIVIAGGTWWITWQQGKLEDKRVQDAQKLENQRAEAEQELAEQRAQDEALQAYLDQMSTLLLEKDLRNSVEDSEVRILAQTRTLTMLDTVDYQKRRHILRFLYEANLIDRPNPIISLVGANLRNMNLELVNLGGGAFSIPSTYGSDRGAEFGGGGADLSGADLSETNFSYCSLAGVDLKGANFSNANLTGCGLPPDLSNVPQEALGSPDIAAKEWNPPDAPHGISLTIFGYLPLPQGAVNTDLDGAFLNDANLQFAVFQQADLSGADLISANMRSSWLAAADLGNANFSNADLTYAQLTFASMDDANFKGANLTGANLRGAINLDIEKLDEQAKSLERATMPNGQKYEDWLKDQ